MAYVLAEPPGLSQTFVLNELLFLAQAGERVHVLCLRRPAPGSRRQRAAGWLDGRTSTVPAGRLAPLLLTAATARLLLTRPQRSWPALWWAVRWTARLRRPNELVRLAHASWLAGHVPQGTVRLHAHFAHGPASAALLLSRLTGIPFSFTAHARDMHELSDPRMLAEKVAAARRVVAISAHGRHHLRGLAPAHADRVELVRNGVDRSRFAAGPGEAAPVDRPFTAVTVCRLVRKKGVDTLVAACGLLRRVGIDVPVEVVGEGPEEQELHRLAAGLGVADLVTFRGALPTEDVRRVLARAAVFVLPCRVEPSGDQDGLPVSIVEAMAAGLPVVSTPVAGVPEAVLDGVSGVLVPPDDAAAVAAALLRLRDDRDLRATLGSGALAVADEFDHRAWLLRLRQVLLSDCAPQPAPPGAVVPSTQARAGAPTTGGART